MEQATAAGNKFKVGDRVRCLSSLSFWADIHVGGEYTVTEVDGHYVAVGGVTGRLYASRFELVAPAQPKRFLALIMGRVCYYAHEADSLEGAKKKVLEVGTPGEQFEIVELVTAGKFKVEQPANVLVEVK